MPDTPREVEPTSNPPPSTSTSKSPTSASIKVLIYGLGAIGSFYAFLLSRTPTVQLSVIARSNYDAVRSNGILIQSENHGEHRFHPHAVYRSPREASDAGETEFDFILVASKAVDLEGTVNDLRPVVKGNGEGTCVVIMQNGVGNEDWFWRVWPECTIISGVVCSLFLLSPSPSILLLLLLLPFHTLTSQPPSDLLSPQHFQLVNAALKITID